MPEDQVSITPDVLSFAVAGVYGVERFMFLAGAKSWEWGAGEVTFMFTTYAPEFGGRSYVAVDGNAIHVHVDPARETPYWRREAVPA